MQILKSLWPSRLRGNEEGTAMLIALLMVATLSAVAVAVVQTSIATGQSVALTRSRTQALWYVQGAEQLASNLVSQAFVSSQGKITLATPGLGQTLSVPIQGGIMSMQVGDGSNCFNLNSLGRLADAKDEDASGDVAGSNRSASNSGTVSGSGPDAELFFERLLFGLGLDRTQAQTLVDATADWIDEDSAPRQQGAETVYYTSLSKPRAVGNTAMVTPDELRGVRGFEEAIFRLVRPYVCTRPNRDIGVFNINTMTALDAPLLYPVFSELVTMDTLAALLEAGNGAFGSTNAFLSDPALAIVAPEQRIESVLSDASNSFHVTGEVVYLDTHTPYEAIFRVDEAGQIKLVRRRLGVDE